MSLGRLLTAGRSLVGGNHSGLRYRMTDPKAMPKFNSARNPFRSKAGVETLAEEAPSPSSVVAPAAEEPAPARAVEAPAAGSPEPAPKRPSLLARWISALKGRFSRSRPVQPNSGIPRFAKSAVQTELSLERIQVVRNDLSDADLEIVPTKSTPKPNRKARGQQTAQPALGLEGGSPQMESAKTSEVAPAVTERADELLATTRS